MSPSDNVHRLRTHFQLERRIFIYSLPLQWTSFKRVYNKGRACLLHEQRRPVPPATRSSCAKTNSIHCTGNILLVVHLLLQQAHIVVILAFGFRPPLSRNSIKCANKFRGHNRFDELVFSYVGKNTAMSMCFDPPWQRRVTYITLRSFGHQRKTAY